LKRNFIRFLPFEQGIRKISRPFILCVCNKKLNWQNFCIGF